MSGRTRKAYRPNRLPVVALLPALILISLFLILPGIVVLALSFRPGTSFQIGSIFTGTISFEHYARLISNPDLFNSFIRSVTYVAAVVGCSVVLGMLTAVLLQKPFRSRNPVQLLLLLPWAVPGVVVAVLFLWMFNQGFGVVNSVLLRLGIIEDRIGWLTDVHYAMAGVVMPTVWKTYPFIAMTLIAAMKAIPASLFEAASIDGASEWQKFVFITVPSVMPALILASIITALLSFKEFDFIYPLTGGGPVRATETLAIQVYNEAFRFFRLETAAALGVVTTIIAGIIAAVGYRYLRREYFR